MDSSRTGRSCHGRRGQARGICGSGPCSSEARCPCAGLLRPLAELSCPLPPSMPPPVHTLPQDLGPKPSFSLACSDPCRAPPPPTGPPGAPQAGEGPAPLLPCPSLHRQPRCPQHSLPSEWCPSRGQLLHAFCCPSVQRAGLPPCFRTSCPLSRPLVHRGPLTRARSPRPLRPSSAPALPGLHPHTVWPRPVPPGSTSSAPALQSSQGV